MANVKESLSELRGYLSARVAADVADWANDIIDQTIEHYESDVAAAYTEGHADGEDYARGSSVDDDDYYCPICGGCLLDMECDGCHFADECECEYGCDEDD